MHSAVVIPSLGRVEHLDRCLERLDALTVMPDEVIVVLQGEYGASLAESVQSRQPRATVVVTEHVGAAVARNAGAAFASAELILFIDDDCLADPAWLESYQREFMKHSALGIAGGKVLPWPEAADEDLVVGTQTSDRPMTFTRRRNPVGVADRAGNMAIRAPILRDLGGFDATLGAGSRFLAAEDTDLIYRAMRSGVEIRYLPQAVVYHDQWRSLSERIRAERGYAVGLGAFIAGHARTGDLYALTLAPRLIWHMGMKPLAEGIVRRHGGRARVGLAYLLGIPLGMTRAARRRPELHRFDPVKRVGPPGSETD